ncbi:hypothetical protein NX059_010018 [Plenodomus lindquistii]|nr:hypothetical protein NX059_010018 [Plenodomus lindquistii]
MKGLKSPLPPPQSPLCITEILSLMFSSLDGPSLIRASLVCKAWRDTVDFSRDTARFTFKFPKKFSAEVPSHFHKPCKSYKDQEQAYLTQRAKLEEAGDITRESLERISSPIIILGKKYGFQGLPVLDCMRIADSHLDRIKDRDKWWRVRNANRHHDKVKYIRAMFRGVRLGGSGWPAGLREIYCETCACFHPRFRFEHVHPVLRFLEDTNICVRGQETTLRIQLDLFNEEAAPISCYEHYCAEMIQFAEGLRTTMKMIGPGGCGNEFFSEPITTKIVIPGYRVIEDLNGLTLATVVPTLVERFHFHVTDNRNQVHQFIPAQHSWYHTSLMSWKSTCLHVRAAYNDSEEDYTAHKQKFSEIVNLVEKAVITVDETMRGVEIWQPVSGTEPDLEGHNIRGSDMIQVEHTDTEESE